MRNKIKFHSTDWLNNTSQKDKRIDIWHNDRDEEIRRFALLRILVSSFDVIGKNIPS